MRLNFLLKQQKVWLAVLLLLLTIAVRLLFIKDAAGISPGILDYFSNFATVFLEILIEAFPFLLLGTLGSGIVEVYFSKSDFAKIIPDNKLAAAVMGAGLGLFFPVCECGVIPMARRLVRKGLPVSTGITFLLAAPVINPVVLASTWAAFGWSPILWGRIGLTLLVAIVTGIVFALALNNTESFFDSEKGQPEKNIVFGNTENIPETNPGNVKTVLLIAADEFFEMGQYLVIGSSMAALMQTFIPQTWLLGLGNGPLLSILVMILLAVLLSVCSTVDAFIALAFSSSFSAGSILAFLVFGPMIDIKSMVMLSGLLPRKNLAALIIVPLALTIFSSLVWNLYFPW
jgi:uncharacterized membrane protein YraQ (UPF0718 family)